MTRGAVLVLGGTGGIGAAVVARLRQQGRRVICASRSAPRVEDDDTVHASLDLADQHLAQRLVALSERHPDIDSVIHCAGQNAFGSLGSLSVDQIDRLLDVNLRSAILIARHFLGRLPTTGHLVFVGSSLGSIGFPGYSAYCASKFGLRGFVEALQREQHELSCPITYVAPRATRTTMNPAQVEAMNTALGNHSDDPYEVARQILDAMQKGQRRRLIGWPERFFIAINGAIPRLVDRGIQRQLTTIRRFL